MRITFDYDDTLVGFIEPLIQFHNYVYGTKLTNDDFNSYKFWEVWGGTMEEAVRKVDIFSRSIYFDRIKAIDGAREAVEELRKYNFLDIVTSRPLDLEDKTKKSVELIFPNSFEGVYLSNKYGVNGARRSKSDIFNELGSDVVIEDSAEFAKEGVKDGRLVFLFNRRWNIDEKVSSKIIRVDYFPQVVEIIKKYR